MNTEEKPWDTQGYSRSIMPQLQGNIESAPDILKMKKKNIRTADSGCPHVIKIETKIERTENVYRLP